MQRKLSRLLLLSTGLLLLTMHAALAQRREGFRVSYTVSVASIDEQLFHVTTDIRNISEPRLDLSLPVWTPGWYTVENYFKNVLRFKITDPKGNRIEPQMIRKQTWRVETKGLDSIKVEYD